ncbi:MAG: hypothetical protein M0P69_04390 [Bacteroidales bacterium]|nr:hypothetical protein [Bacteroidales bacterium]
MKRLFSFLLCVAVCGSCFGGDLVKVQVCYRKAVWQCPNGVDEITNMNVVGPNNYDYICSDGSKPSDYTLYTDCLAYPLNDYNPELVESDKDKKFLKWNEERKKPIQYIEPSKDDYLHVYNEKLKETQMYLDKLKDKLTSNELSSLNTLNKEKK